MTIQFQGHVECVSRSPAPTDHVHVYVVTDSGVGPEGIHINVPKSEAAHWLVGKTVSITMYAYDPQPPQGEGHE